MTDIAPAAPVADRIHVPGPDPASPCLVLACDVLADGGLKLSGYEAGCGRAFRAVLRRDPDGNWFVEDRLRLVGLGGPYDRASVEARGEAALLAWASLRGDEAEAVRGQAQREAQGRPRAVDESRQRKARNNRRQAEIQERLALTLGGQLADRIGRSLDGFPVTFEMTHRGVRYDVTVSEGEPLLRIAGGADGPLAIGWDGTAGSRGGPLLPTQAMRSLALQSTRRRPELLQAMAPLLKARWAALSHRAEADRLDGAQPQAALPDRAGTLPVAPAPERIGWRTVTPLTGDRLQVCLHDLHGARQVHALVQPVDGVWTTHEAMSALSFRTGRREELRDPELAEAIRRIAAAHAGATLPAEPVDAARDDRDPDTDDDGGQDDPAPFAEAAVPSSGPDEPEPAPALPEAIDPDPAPEAGPPPRAMPPVEPRPLDPGTSPDPQEAPPADAGPAVAPPLPGAVDPHADAAGDGDVPAHADRAMAEPAAEASVEVPAAPPPPPDPPAGPGSAVPSVPAAPDPLPAPAVAPRPAAPPPAPADPQGWPGPARADAGIGADPAPEHDAEFEFDDPEDDPEAAGEPDFDATLVDPGDLPEDDLDALDLVMASRRAPARSATDEAALARLRPAVALADKLRDSGEPYPDFPYEQRMSGHVSQRELIVRVVLDPVPGFEVEPAIPVDFRGRMVKPGCAYRLNGKPREANPALLAMEASGFAYATWCSTFRSEADKIVQEGLADSAIGIAARGEFARLQIAVIERMGSEPR